MLRYAFFRVYVSTFYVLLSQFVTKNR